METNSTLSPLAALKLRPVTDAFHRSSTPRMWREGTSADMSSTNCQIWRELCKLLWLPHVAPGKERWKLVNVLTLNESSSCEHFSVHAVVLKVASGNWFCAFHCVDKHPKDANSLKSSQKRQQTLQKGRLKFMQWLRWQDGGTERVWQFPSHDVENTHVPEDFFSFCYDRQRNKPVVWKSENGIICPPHDTLAWKVPSIHTHWALGTRRSTIEFFCVYFPLPPLHCKTKLQPSQSVPLSYNWLALFCCWPFLQKNIKAFLFSLLQQLGGKNCTCATQSKIKIHIRPVSFPILTAIAGPMYLNHFLQVRTHWSANWLSSGICLPRLSAHRRSRINLWT